MSWEIKGAAELSKIRLHFGKYDGTLISEVPADYLEWMVEKRAQYWNFARDELARRERSAAA